MASTLVDLTVPCDQAAPAVVRAAISELAGVERPVLQDTKLVASELVTNAVRHSSCRDEESLAVRVARDGGLRISVLDPSRVGGVAEIVDRRMELDGLGLRIVSKLADRWGSERRDDGYEVWAELELRRKRGLPVCGVRAHGSLRVRWLPNCSSLRRRRG